MIRRENFAQPIEAFASERRDIITRAEDSIRPHARDALSRVGLPQWFRPLVSEALDLFDATARAEVDAWGPVLDDLHDAFAKELSDALEQTNKMTGDAFDHQVETITRWVSQMAHNAAMEAAATSDTDSKVGLEWVTMGDSKVREPHQDANGQVVPSGQEFEVGGEKMLYPGQPVGDPSNWINCRCVARPTSLDVDFAARRAGFSIREDFAAPLAEDQVVAEEYTSTVIVALPAADDPISGASSESSGAHATLLFLGDSSALDEEALKSAVEQFVTDGQVGVITEQVNGRATLGKDAADVVLFDAANLVFIREGLLGMDALSTAYSSVEQFPTWLPHVTLGYPETPAAQEYRGEVITFDRLAVWHGETRTEYKLGETMDPDAPEPTDQKNLTAAGEAPPLDEEIVPDEPTPEEIAESEALMAAIEGLDDEAYPEIPWHSIVTVEASPSEDNRQFAGGALDSRNLPLPIKAQFIDDDGHDGSVIVGRMDRVFREGNLIKAEGIFDSTPQAYEALRMVAGGFWRGVSVDVAAVEGAYSEDESGAGIAEYTKARIASVTLCAIPAFAEAYIALGTWDDAGAETAVRTAETPEAEAEFKSVPTKTKDGPGWVTDPAPTKRITDYWVDGTGAAKIGWGAPGDFNRCRANLAKYVQNPEWLAGLCANLHYRALGTWPGHGAGKASELTAITASGDQAKRAPLFNLVASGAATKTKRVSVDYFVNPKLEGPTPFTVTEDGHVFGHIATWGTCHIGFKDECILAPESATDYAYFLTGEVLTDAGPVAVGQITMDGPHAAGNLSMSQTIAHYDNTTTPVADVNVGEDAFGIWASGVIRPGVDEDDIYALRAAAISGDWRGVVVGGEENLEMVAALAVNVPGFPIPRPAFSVDEGRQVSLVAAGIPMDEVEAKARVRRAEQFKIKVREARAADLKASIASMKEA